MDCWLAARADELLREDDSRPKFLARHQAAIELLDTLSKIKFTRSQFYERR